MYIFVTYGIPGWRGVQARGVAIAKYFDKKEVIFWNGYDSDFIKDHGFKCQTIDLSLTDPNKIKIPKETKAIVYADLPTNELFNFSLFISAKKQGIPIVILDQIYRRGQMKEGVYKMFAKYADLFLVNGLDFMKSEESDNVKLIPPLPEYTKNPIAKEVFAKRYNIDINKTWICVSGYYKPALDLAKQALELIPHHKKKYELILTGEKRDKLYRQDNILFMPYQTQEEFLATIDASDIFISKFGFLQILEALALYTPTIIAGQGGYVLKKEILDKNLLDVLRFSDNPNNLAEGIEELSKDKISRQWIIDKLEKYHSSGQYGAKIASELIKKIKRLNSKTKLITHKKLFIVVNEELEKVDEFISDKPGAYILGLIASVSSPGPDLNPVKKPNRELLNLPIAGIISEQKGEILPHTFKEVFILSQRKYDGLLDIIPWYDDWIKRLLDLFKNSDEIYITEKALYLVFNLLRPYNTKIKVIKL
ncbi:hypothetical protein HYT02_02130 [Candidatus Gottesmanbacteria bacterium]|nr:hypothetical protein [Candidatus Gottesmanbacteria bacterium]